MTQQVTINGTIVPPLPQPTFTTNTVGTTNDESTLLSLDEWRDEFGLHPWFFWDIADNEQGGLKPSSNCSGVLKKYASQNTDTVSRENILDAIRNAEALFREYAGYDPAPKYREQTLPFPRPEQNGLHYTIDMDSNGQWLSLILPRTGFVSATGVEARSLIGTPTVTYSDEDGDGYLETWTATVATTVDLSEIAVYVPSAYRMDGDGVSEVYRIRPVTLKAANGVVTIKGRTWLMVKPYRYEGVSRMSVSPADPANNVAFLQTVEVYRRYCYTEGQTNTTSQGLLIWESLPWPAWASCCGSSSTPTSSTDPYAIASAIARVGIRDGKNGIVIPGSAAYDSTTSSWNAQWWSGCRQPDRATIRSYAGHPLNERYRMDNAHKTCIARLAAAELARPVCANDSSHAGNRDLHYWQFDMSRSAGVNDEQYSISPEDLNNPLGTRRGHIYAWRFIKNQRPLRGFLV